MNRYRPSYEEFARHLDSSASCIPVYRQLTGDGLTPVSAFRRIERTAPSFLFESVIGGEKVGRFSFLGTEPFLRFEARGREVQVVEPGREAEARRFTAADPFAELQRLLERHRAAPMPGLPRFAGGAVGFAAYDAVRYTEDLPDIPPDDRGLPDLSFAFYDRMVLFDHIRKTILVVAQAHVGPSADPRAAYRDACDRVDELVDRLAAPSPDLGVCDIATDTPPRWRSGPTSPASGTRRSSATARNTSRPATSSRSSPASGSRSRPAPTRSTSTGCCGSSIPARSCSTCRSAISP